MKTYELVLVLNPQISKEEHEILLQKVESLFPNSFLEKDDIGVLKIYNFKPSKKNANLAYYISYHLQLDTQSITSLKRELSITKNIFRFVFFVMSSGESFLKYKDINDLYISKITDLEESNSKKNKKTISNNEQSNLSDQDNNESQIQDEVDVVPEDIVEFKKSVKKKKENE